jgi:hypothetical protein
MKLEKYIKKRKKNERKRSEMKNEGRFHPTNLILKDKIN